MDCRLSIKRVLVDGILLSVLLSIIIYGSMWVNPLMWVSDYPPDIRTEVGAVDVPLAQIAVAGLLFVGVIAGVAVMMQGGPAFTRVPDVIKALEDLENAEGAG